MWSDRLKRRGAVVLVERCPVIGVVDLMADAGLDELCGEVYLDIVATMSLSQRV